MTFDPGMDRSPDAWQSPEIDPDFRDAIPQAITPDNDSDPYGEVQFADAGQMHRESLDAIAKLDAGIARLIETIMNVRRMILRIDAGQTLSRSARLRVQWIIISRATPGDAVLGVGTETFAFTVAAAPVRIDFPLVIGEGVDLAYTGDGRIYLVCDTE